MTTEQTTEQLKALWDMNCVGTCCYRDQPAKLGTPPFEPGPGWALCSYHQKVEYLRQSMLSQQAEPPKTQEIPNPISSFDARVWARTFVAILKKHPDIAIDEATMITWFANALMRGYDERAAQHLELQKTFKQVTDILTSADDAALTREELVKRVREAADLACLDQ